MQTNSSLSENLFTEAFTQNPFPTYEQMREKEPIMRMLFPDGHYGWIITRYSDAVEALKDPRFVKDMRNAGIEEDMLFINNNMLFSDPPDHKRLRGLVQKAFTPQLISGMRERIQQIADELLAEVEGQESINLIDEYAFPLPIIVISEMLGVPNSDRDKFRVWSNALIERSGREPDEDVRNLIMEFREYLADWFSKVKQQPGNDLISQLIIAEEQGDRLTEHELFNLVMLLIIAGHETTVNLIGNGILALLQHPEQLRALQSRPELIHTAIEEVLRYNGPVEFSTGRWVKEDLEFKGVSMKRGESVIISLSSANRDPEQFNDPDLFDISREKSPHLAFGKGIHLCLGAPLARLEGEIAINTLLKRYPNIRLKVDVSELEWRPGMIVRGVKEMPLYLE
ncbi:cytochrome P450 family protein [Paenibacillus woosongensis]|uniref:Cytochrome P450 n=1 Tax=Paenibacillus woosongensis TaxID=307580 RepID=A0A7X2Z1E7_9BACL|nr:cytochrome P450 [Paenibacillus woosongensis]MUG45819.1 cytochrome P450 [Paenibacillus woosongensis]